MISAISMTFALVLRHLRAVVLLQKGIQVITIGGPMHLKVLHECTELKDILQMQVEAL